MSPDDGTVFPPEPPPEFVAFVARTRPGARTAAGRLTGADRYADEVYPEAFADVATGWPWRRLVDVDRLLDRRLRTRVRPRGTRARCRPPRGRRRLSEDRNAC